MATETQEKTTTAASEAAAPPAEEKPARRAEAKPEPEQRQTRSKPETESRQSTAEGPRRATLKGDDDDIPDDADLLELSQTALRKRLDRHTKKELKERFGTDNFDQIKAKLARAEELEKAEEDRKRASMDAEARLKDDLAKANARATAAERREAVAREARVVDQQDGRLKDIATKYIRAKNWRHVSRDLADHLSTAYSDKELRALPDKAIEKWFKEYVSENPEFAKGEEAAAKDKRVPATNGADDGSRQAPARGADAAGKTFKPGQANSMTRQEARDAARKEGYSW